MTRNVSKLLYCTGSWDDCSVLQNKRDKKANCTCKVFEVHEYATKRRKKRRFNLISLLKWNLLINATFRNLNMNELVFIIIIGRVARSFMSMVLVLQFKKQHL